MNSDEKAIARRSFKLKIHESDGQSFEDLFTRIMYYAEPEFRQIKASGSIGDSGNDGYIQSKGIYFQVYAPEDIRKSDSKAATKLRADFSKLIKKWQNIRKYCFVINDKYKGISPHLEQAIQEISENHTVETEIWQANKLENLTFSLDDDQILEIACGLPDPAKINLDYSIVSEVISHLMKVVDISPQDNRDIDYPDWDSKIEFNNLTKIVAGYLNNGSLQVATLDEYLDNQSNFFADEVKDKIRKIYLDKAKDLSGDNLFWAMVNTISPQSRVEFKQTVIILMAKYFEVCDIFEDPKSK